MIKELVLWMWNALFLKETPYIDIGRVERPVIRGLLFVTLIALVSALAGLVGTAFEWATTPKMETIKQVVFEELQQMPWYQQMQSPEFEAQFKYQYDLGWRIFPTLFGAPDFGSATLGLVASPLLLIIRWLLYGVLAYFFIRLLGTKSDISYVLGSTALAFAPQALNWMAVFPYVHIGRVVGIWMIACRYMALKSGIRLTWQKALAATMLPYVVLTLPFVLLAGLGILMLIIGGITL